MKIYSQDGSELMEVQALERDGNQLVIKGNVFGSMPMTVKLKAEEARQGLKLLNFKLTLFLLTILFRRWPLSLQGRGQPRAARRTKRRSQVRIKARDLKSISFVRLGIRIEWA